MAALPGDECRKKGSKPKLMAGQRFSLARVKIKSHGVRKEKGPKCPRNFHVTFRYQQHHCSGARAHFLRKAARSSQARLRSLQLRMPGCCLARSLLVHLRNAQIKCGINQHHFTHIRTHQCNPAEDSNLKIFNDVNFSKENFPCVEF